MPERERLVHFIEEPIDTALERRVGTQLGHEVVVVGVEPLGHFHGGLFRVSARELEILSPGKRARIEPEARRQRAQQHRVVEDVIVEREIACGDVPEASVALHLPMAVPELGARSPQCVVIRLRIAPPERLQRELELAPCADARKTENVCACHALHPVNPVARSVAVGVQ